MSPSAISETKTILKRLSSKPLLKHAKEKKSTVSWILTLMKPCEKSKTGRKLTSNRDFLNFHHSPKNFKKSIQNTL